jgi:hypothetical protein
VDRRERTFWIVILALTAAPLAWVLKVGLWNHLSYFFQLLIPFGAAAAGLIGSRFKKHRALAKLISLTLLDAVLFPSLFVVAAAKSGYADWPPPVMGFVSNGLLGLCVGLLCLGCVTVVATRLFGLIPPSTAPVPPWKKPTVIVTLTVHLLVILFGGLVIIAGLSSLDFGMHGPEGEGIRRTLAATAAIEVFLFGWLPFRIRRLFKRVE